MMRMSDRGLALLKAREGERLLPYLDTRGIPTIGVGLTSYPDGRFVTMADPPITREQSDAMFRARLAEFERGVDAVLRRPPAQNQFDAMVSLAFNIGLGGFRGSSVLKRFNIGDIEGAADAFMMWTKNEELIKRREGEMEQFLPGAILRRALKAAGAPATPSAPAAPAPPPAPKPWSGVISFIASLFKKR